MVFLGDFDRYLRAGSFSASQGDGKLCPNAERSPMADVTFSDRCEIAGRRLPMTADDDWLCALPRSTERQPLTGFAAVSAAGCESIASRCYTLSQDAARLGAA